MMWEGTPELHRLTAPAETPYAWTRQSEEHGFQAGSFAKERGARQSASIPLCAKPNAAET
jgi:hypothetical protein